MHSRGSLPSSIPSWRIIALAFALRFLFLIGTPLEEKQEPFTLSAFNDEKSHYNYALHIAYEGYRPVQIHNIRQSYAEGLNDYEYYQPPLYYRIAGLMVQINPFKLDGIYILRFFNLILGLMLILTVGKVLYILFPRYTAPGMLFLSVLSSTVFFSSTVTNDVLLWLTTALIAYYGLEIMERPGWRHRIFLVLAFSAGIWSKLSALVLLPAVIYSLYISFRGQRTGVKILFTAAGLVLSLLFTFPLFRENYLYYHSLIPLSVGLGPPYPPLEALTVKNALLSLNYFLHSFYFPFENYWQGMVQMILFSILGIISLAVIVIGLKGSIEDYIQSLAFRRHQYLFLALTLFSAMMGFMLMTINYHQSEARLVFVALPAITLLFLNGLLNILRIWKFSLERKVLVITGLPYILFMIN